MDSDLLKKLSRRIGDDKPSAVETSHSDGYVSPQVIVHDGDEFIRSLGPAQACSPTIVDEGELSSLMNPFKSRMG